MTTSSNLEPPSGVETETYIVNEMYVVFQSLVTSWNNNRGLSVPRKDKTKPGEDKSLTGEVDIMWRRDSTNTALFQRGQRQDEQNWKLLVGQFQHNAGKSFLIVRTVQN